MSASSLASELVHESDKGVCNVVNVFVSLCLFLKCYRYLPYALEKPCQQNFIAQENISFANNVAAHSLTANSQNEPGTYPDIYSGKL